MAERYCRVCGAPIIGKQRNAIYCGDRCRRRAHNMGLTRSALDDESTDAGRLEVRRRLAAASYVKRRCRCPNPLGLVDEEGEVRCFRCGWPLARGRRAELPPRAA